MPQIMTKRTTVYSFKELSEEAQERAMENYRESFDFDFHQEYLLEDIKDSCPHIEDMDIEYTGFWSQGDGASFTGTLDTEWTIEFLNNYYRNSTYPDNMALEHIVQQLRYIDISFVRTSSMYSHENTCKAMLSGEPEWSVHVHESEPLLHAFGRAIPEFEAVIDQYRSDLCHDIYERLRDEYNHYTSEEAITEYFDSNNFLFEQDGTAY